MAIIDVVKYDGNPQVFAWKHPNQELSTWTQVIVNESQEAVLYKGGQALDWFGPGRHTLETKNIPVLNKLINLPFGGRSPFTAEVWYVNKITSLDVKWGTPTPIQIQDPKYKVFIPVRAHGQFGIRIKDSKLFLQKLVGTLPSFTAEDITKYFKGAYLTKAKDDISSYVVKEKVSVLEINAYMDEISESLKEKINPLFADYGIELVNFYVNDISVPENDTAVVKLKDALAKKAEMDIIGYSYTQERSFDTLEGAAKNEGSNASQLMGAGIGLGMGAGIGGNMGGAFGDMSKNINVRPQRECPHCHVQVSDNSKFCSNCGKDMHIASEQVICSKCGASNNKGVKFCAECGNGLVKICNKCQEKVEPNQKFCPNCGEAMVKKCNHCGAALEGDLKFCPDCGKEVGGEDNA